MPYRRKSRITALLGLVLVLAQGVALAHATQHLLGMDNNPCPGCVLKKRLDHAATCPCLPAVRPVPAQFPTEAAVLIVRDNTPRSYNPRAPPLSSLAYS